MTRINIWQTLHVDRVFSVFKSSWNLSFKFFDGIKTPFCAKHFQPSGPVTALFLIIQFSYLLAGEPMNKLNCVTYCSQSILHYFKYLILNNIAWQTKKNGERDSLLKKDDLISNLCGRLIWLWLQLSSTNNILWPNTFVCHCAQIYVNEFLSLASIAGDPLSGSVFFFFFPFFFLYSAFWLEGSVTVFHLY